MKAFFVSSGIVFSLLVVGMILVVVAPQAGIWIGLTFFLIPAFALFKPLPKLFLGHRVFSASIALLVGLLTSLGSFGALSEANRLAELRDAAPEVYLLEVRTRDKAMWLSELRELAPEEYAAEIARIEDEKAAQVTAAEVAQAERLARQQEEEVVRAAEQKRLEAERRAEAEAQRRAQQQAQLLAHVEQLNREIASIPSMDVSDYTGDVSRINTGLLLIGAWALLYEQGESLDLDEAAQRKRKEYRQLIVRTQLRMLPVMRDAYGPAMRHQLWEADGSARTIGAGFRTVEFVSAAFARNANIKQIHTEIRENLMMLRFTRAQYKWFRSASEYSYFDMKVPSDSDLVMWETGGRYRVLD